MDKDIVDLLKDALKQSMKHFKSCSEITQERCALQARVGLREGEIDELKKELDNKILYPDCEMEFIFIANK